MTCWEGEQFPIIDYQNSETIELMIYGIGGTEDKIKTVGTTVTVHRCPFTAVTAEHSAAF